MKGGCDMKKLTKPQFIESLEYAVDQAFLNRNRPGLEGRPIREAIECARLPLPPIKDLSLKLLDSELRDNPIYRAVEAASKMQDGQLPVVHVIALIRLVEAAWEHYACILPPGDVHQPIFARPL
jgi:hypothetical protein